MSPLAFVRSGYVGIDFGQARGVGKDGYFWSRTSNSSTKAYDLGTNPTDVYPSGNPNRFGAFPLRCLY